jgi:hypothetical protein
MDIFPDNFPVNHYLKSFVQKESQHNVTHPRTIQDKLRLLFRFFIPVSAVLIVSAPGNFLKIFMSANVYPLPRLIHKLLVTVYALTIDYE